MRYVIDHPNSGTIRFTDMFKNVSTIFNLEQFVHNLEKIQLCFTSISTALMLIDENSIIKFFCERILANDSYIKTGEDDWFGPETQFKNCNIFEMLHEN